MCLVRKYNINLNLLHFVNQIRRFYVQIVYPTNVFGLETI